MKKILLIGGCGYIGSALYLHLKKMNYDVHTVDLEYFGNFNGNQNLSNFKTDYDLLSKKYLDSRVFHYFYGSLSTRKND